MSYFMETFLAIVLCNIPCDVSVEALFQLKLHEFESSFSFVIAALRYVFISALPPPRGGVHVHFKKIM